MLAAFCIRWFPQPFGAAERIPKLREAFRMMLQSFDYAVTQRDFVTSCKKFPARSTWYELRPAYCGSRSLAALVRALVSPSLSSAGSGQQEVGLF